MNQETKKTFSLKILFNVLFWGAAWGIVEATLGTILHLPAFDGAGIYLASSTVIIPIAYVLMANCYKRTQSFYSVYLMGVLAALIKLTTAFAIGFINKVYMPAMYIVVEALAMGTALALIRPTNVLSFKTLGAVIAANTVYQFAYLNLRMIDGAASIYASTEAWQGAEKYLLTINCVAIIYSFAIGVISYGVLKLAEKKNFNFKFDLDKLIHSPIMTTAMLVLAVALTVALKFVK